MKWIYVSLSIGGAAIPVIWVYMSHIHRAVSGSYLDLGLLLFSLGLGLVFMPLGLVGGLALAGGVHLLWSRNRRRSHYSE